MLHLLDCALPFALFLGANYPASLTLGSCSYFAVAIGNLLSGFTPPFLSPFLLIRKVGFSLSKLIREKKSPFLS